MVKNQLFRILPDIDIINIILDTFDITSLDDTRVITIESIKGSNTVNRINSIKGDLEKYYLPCKRIYLHEITIKRCIVILRQFIKVHGYTLFSRERHINGIKLIVYRIIEDDKISSIDNTKINKPIVISFQ